MAEAMASAAGNLSERRGPLARVEHSVTTANLIVVCVGLIIAVIAWPRWELRPIVDMQPAMQKRLGELEESLRLHPDDGAAAAEVARIWRDLGQPAWSYAALREAERDGAHQPRARLQLAAAYLDLGQVADAKRLLDEANRLCPVISCDPALRFKIDLFREVTDLMIKEGVKPDRDPVFLARVLQKFIKQVEIKRGELGLPDTPPDEPGDAPTAQPAER